MAVCLAAMAGQDPLGRIEALEECRIATMSLCQKANYRVYGLIIHGYICAQAVSQRHALLYG